MLRRGKRGFGQKLDTLWEDRKGTASAICLPQGNNLALQEPGWLLENFGFIELNLSIQEEEGRTGIENQGDAWDQQLICGYRALT